MSMATAYVFAVQFGVVGVFTGVLSGVLLFVRWRPLKSTCSFTVSLPGMNGTDRGENLRKNPIPVLLVYPKFSVGEADILYPNMYIIHIFLVSFNLLQILLTLYKNTKYTNGMNNIFWQIKMSRAYANSILNLLVEKKTTDVDRYNNILNTILLYIDSNKNTSIQVSVKQPNLKGIKYYVSMYFRYKENKRVGHNVCVTIDYKKPPDYDSVEKTLNHYISLLKHENIICTSIKTKLC